MRVRNVSSIALRSRDGTGVTRSLEGRFRQGVNLHLPRSEAVRGARERPLLTAVIRPNWHGRGTSPAASTWLDRFQFPGDSRVHRSPAQIT